MPVDRTRLKAALLLTGALGFLALGQHYLFYRQAYVWDALIFLAIALACFVALMRTIRLRQPSPPRHTRTQRRIRRWTVVIGLALLLNLVAARSANAQPPPTDFTFSAALWLLSLLLLFIGSREDGVRSRAYPPRTTHHDLRLASFAAVLLLIGFALRIWNLEHIPANLSGDEGTQAMWAVDVLRGHLRNPFSTGWFTVPTMSFFAQAASLRLFGDNVAGLRTLSALIGTATLGLTYLLTREILGRRVALFALAVLTFNHYHIHFSRLGSNQIADPFFMTLTLWLLTKGTPDIRHPTPHPSLWLIAAGLATGLSWYGYFGSRVITLVVVAWLGILALTERDFLRRHARALTLMAIAAFMAASPLLLHYANHPENLSARWNQVNFFRWLKNELARPGHDSTFELVVRQIWRSVSAFNHTLDPTFWYRAQIPLLDFVSGMLFILGLIVAISRWRRPAERLTLLWFGLAITFGWVLTENPPSSMRMTVVVPAVAILVALGLDRLLTLARRIVGGHRAGWNGVAAALLALVAILNTHYYFIVYTPTRVYGNPTAETATVLARYLGDRDDHPFVYFYGPPFMYFDFGAIQFIARDVPGVSVPPRDEQPNFPTPITGPTLFVVLRERLDELGAIQANHPNGELREFYSAADRRLMFVVYQVSQ